MRVFGVSCATTFCRCPRRNRPLAGVRDPWGSERAERKREPSGEHLAFAEAGVDRVNGGVQARAFSWWCFLEEVGLPRDTGLFQSEEHDAGLAVANAGKVEVFDLVADAAKDYVRSIGWSWEDNRTPYTVPPL